MHDAHFQFESGSLPTQEFHLDERVAEWLFAQKFWAEINAEVSSHFDQYEQDCADVRMSSIICSRLQRLCRELDSACPVVTFVRGWQSNGTPIEVSLDGVVLRDQLRTLRDFFCRAVEQNTTVVCDL